MIGFKMTYQNMHFSAKSFIRYVFFIPSARRAFVGHLRKMQSHHYTSSAPIYNKKIGNFNRTRLLVTPKNEKNFTLRKFYTGYNAPYQKTS